ncbi:MAG: cupin domain-containing protein [Gammaproteobacteria bacterium]|nr:cupin domain-containing protein [Gammaproteobacteria bacterium]
MKKKLEDMGYSVNQYVYPPGTSFPEHSHGVDKIDGVLPGHFKMTLYGDSIILQAGDMLVVPKGVEHSAEVIGNESVVSLDVIKQEVNLNY